MGPCQQGAVAKQPYVSSSTSSLLRRWKTSWVENFVGTKFRDTRASHENNPLYGMEA